MKINIISSGLVNNNVRSLLFPIIKFNKFFESMGLEFSIKNKVDKNCDILFIESNFIEKRYVKDFNGLIKDFKNWKKNVKKVIYFDTSDSTSVLHPKLINYVDVYCKAQIFKNLKNYERKFYGNRIFTDYAYKKFGIIDEFKSFSEKIEEDNQKKIKIYWNSGVMNHSFLGRIYSHIYKSLPINKLLNYPRLKDFKKKNNLFFYMTTEYARNTVAWHRKYALKKASLECNHKRLNIINYFKKLSESKVCLSPFGWGEINYRDFEAFIYGTLLVKPNMNHLKTWPEFFNEKQLVFYDWSCKDLPKKINEIISNYHYFKKIANSAQKNYLDFLNSDRLHKLIYKRIIDIIQF